MVALAGRAFFGARLGECGIQGMAAAYPKRADGRTFFPFRRLFMVGVRQ